jgi:ubiquinone/menaquinone biosynthesis C-methylase UbiE
MTYEEKTVSQTIGRLLNNGPDPDGPAGRELDNLDQFHIGGADATDLLIGSLALGRGDRVLDVGSGFGGPARQIARRTGNRVVGIDITPAYVEAARDLSLRAGLGDLTEFRTGDIATFEPDPLFPAAITMHVQMNVEDKTAWFAQIARCLVPGARLAVWEVCQPAGQEADLPWPMPWSFDGTDSFVATAGSLRTAIEQGGFTVTEWTNETAWVQAWITKTFAGGLPAGPALPMLLDDGYTRVMNFAAALGNGSVEIWRGAFTRNAGAARGGLV